MFFKDKGLGKEQLVDLGIAVAYKLGLKPLGFRDVNRCFGTKELAITINNAGMLMIDREFIRIEDVNDNVSYAYITQRHIDEIRRASSRAGSFTKIPADIEMVLYTAEEAMKASGKSYWINPEYDETCVADSGYDFSV